MMRMPALFIGHGNPMHALDDNLYTQSWHAIADGLPRPKAILAISAHWYIEGTHVTAKSNPRTIHDFGGFPQALFDVRYPAPGSPDLAHRVKSALAPFHVELDHEWGLDHGTWSVLLHMFPKADIPVVQLSIDMRRPNTFHYDLGKRLSVLRDEGVLIIGLGNIVHNLSLAKWGKDALPYGWAVEFEAQARELIEAHRHRQLINYQDLGAAAELSIPTPEHYLPLLYILGTQREGETAQVVIEGIDMASISMLSVEIK